VVEIFVAGTAWSLHHRHHSHFGVERHREQMWICESMPMKPNMHVQPASQQYGSKPFVTQIILLHNTLLKILNCDMLISRVQTTTLPEPDASGSVSKRRVRFRFKPPISAPPQTRRRLQLRRDSPLLHTLSPARTSRRPAAPNHAENNRRYPLHPSPLSCFTSPSR
jgi:hypothetical protein